jgi:hypothetical protein
MSSQTPRVPLTVGVYPPVFLSDPRHLQGPIHNEPVGLRTNTMEFDTESTSSESDLPLSISSGGSSPTGSKSHFFAPFAPEAPVRRGRTIAVPINGSEVHTLLFSGCKGFVCATACVLARASPPGLPRVPPGAHTSFPLT